MYDTVHGRSIDMHQASKSTSEAWLPQSSSEQAQVREQLQQILAHPLFSQSKRYPVMLRYVVEQTLLGNEDQLKERVIGVEVFDRDPSYDTSVDPVVRFTASEIRKRLAQYYVEREHSSELQIDLPVGSYTAVFHPRPMTQENGHGPNTVEPGVDTAANGHLQVEYRAVVVEPPGQQSVVEQWAPPLPRRTISPKVALGALLIAAAGFCIGHFLHLPLNTPSNPIDQFWSAVTASPGIVTFCVGDPADGPANAAALQTSLSGNPIQPFWNDSSHVAISDVIALSHVSSAFGASGKSYRITAASQTSFFQLREGPIILIGAFDNPWTMRIMQNLRYTFFRHSGADVGILDSQNPSQSQWSMPLNLTADKYSHDFGVVARFHDSTTGQPVVLIAGVAAAGTEAASELLSNRAFFSQMIQNAPRNWPNMNMEVVLETQIIDGHPGPPKILAASYW